MSIKTQPKKCSKLTLIKNTLFGLSFIFVASVNDNPERIQKRDVSSVKAPTLTASSQTFLKNPLIKHTRKLSIPMMTHIKSVKNDDHITLTGHLKVTHSMKMVNVKWVVPKGVKIISGSSNSLLSTTEPGQDYQFQITVEPESSNNQIIQLVVKSEDGSNFYSNSAQYHTEYDEKIKKANHDLYLRSQKYMREHAQLEQ